MAIGQGPAFVVMAVVLWFGSEAVKDFVKIELPKNVKVFAESYERINQDNLRAIQEMKEKDAATIKYLADAFNHNIDRIEKRLEM